MEVCVERREFDLRNNYSAELNEVLRETYPVLFPDGPYRKDGLRIMRRMFTAGVPFNYLEACWSDYQAEDRASLDKIIKFVATIPIRSNAGGGVILSGANGVGKSFLSFMCAIHSMRVLSLPTVCFSIWEYLEKRSYQYINSAPFDELLGMIDRAKVVVLDNLSKESEKIVWKPEDLFEVVERVTTGRRNRCFIINTGISKTEFERQSGGSAFSRLRGFDMIGIRNADFRGKKIDIYDLLEKRAALGTGISSCYRPSIIANPDPKWSPCSTCAYKTRLTLCDIRVRGEWKTDDRTEGPIVHLQPKDNSGTSPAKGNKT